MPMQLRNDPRALYERYFGAVTTGQETLPRPFIVAQNATLTSGRLNISYFVAKKSETVNSMTFVTAGTAAGATPTLIRYGLFSLVGDDGTLVASTPNDTSLFAAASTPYNKALSSGYALTEGVRYAAAVIVVTAAAAPTVQATYCGVANISSIAPRLGGYWGGQTDLPNSFLASNLTTTTTQPYAILLPT